MSRPKAATAFIKPLPSFATGRWGEPLKVRVHGVGAPTPLPPAARGVEGFLRVGPAPWGCWSGVCCTNVGGCTFSPGGSVAVLSAMLAYL